MKKHRLTLQPKKKTNGIVAKECLDGNLHAESCGNACCAFSPTIMRESLANVRDCFPDDDDDDDELDDSANTKPQTSFGNVVKRRSHTVVR